MWRPDALGFLSPPWRSARHLIAAGRLRVPAVAAKQIDAALPDMPTAREEGRVQIAGVWFGGFSARVSRARSSIF